MWFRKKEPDILDKILTDLPTEIKFKREWDWVIFKSTNLKDFECSFRFYSGVRSDGVWGVNGTILTHFNKNDLSIILKEGTDVFKVVDFVDSLINFFKSNNLDIRISTTLEKDWTDFKYDVETKVNNLHIIATRGAK